MALLESGYDWDYPVEPQENGNSFMRHARAKVLGGCSSHNSCIAFWAPAEDLDDWARAGLYGLERRGLLPALPAPGDQRRARATTTAARGPVTIRTVPPHDPCGAALLAACAEAGIPTTPFNTGTTVVRGAQLVPDQRPRGRHPFVRLGVLPAPGPRQAAQPGGTHRAPGQAAAVRRRAALHRASSTWSPDTIHSGTVRARREVIVSCGAIDSPKLLMLSGIGPAGHLREIGVEVRVDSPGVGSHLQDHPEGVIMWEAQQPMVTASTQWWEIGIFADTEPGLDRPDLMFHYGSVPFDMNTYRRGYPTSDNAFCLTPNVTRARSMGTVRLRTRDFRDKPKVDPRYFTARARHPGDDLRPAARPRDRRAGRRWPTGRARSWRPGPARESDDELFDYIRKTHNTVYHPAGTVRMGAADDAGLAARPAAAGQGRRAGCGWPTRRSCRSCPRSIRASPR